jgi:probable HAF family extracellular repeat protein
MKRFFCGLMTLGLFLCMAGEAMGQANYAFTPLDVPGSSASSTSANGMNDSGQIVGYYAGPTGNHGFLLDHGNLTTLDVPGSTSTEAWGINALSQIVGNYMDSAGNIHGFLLDQGSYTTIDVPGSFWTEAHGINASGQIVGWYYVAGGTAHGFLLVNGSFTTLDVPGSSSTRRLGPNRGSLHSHRRRPFPRLPARSG